MAQNNTIITMQILGNKLIVDTDLVGANLELRGDD